MSLNAEARVGPQTRPDGYRAADPRADGPVFPTPRLAEEGRQRDRACPGTPGRVVPLTSLTVIAQSPGSGTARTATGAQHSRQSAARSSRVLASGRLAAAILMMRPPGRAAAPVPLRPEARVFGSGKRRPGGSWRRRERGKWGGRARGEATAGAGPG